MSIYGGPEISTSGLVLYWDAANPKSYGQAQPHIHDLSNNNNSGIVNNITFSSSFGGTINISPINSSNITISSIPQLIIQPEYTVIGATRYNGNTRGRIISSASNNWLLGHWNGGAENYYAEGAIRLVSNNPNDTNWRIYAGTGNLLTDTWSLFVNGNLKITNNGGSSIPNGIVIGGGFYGENSNGQFSFLQVYNRVLTNLEILYNYYAMRGRFGI